MRFSKYRKILIYFFTFLTYIWSGYGSEVLGNFRDAILTAEAVFGDFFKDATNVARKFKDVHEVVEAGAKDSCVFKCPNGALPKPNKNHKPESNGCGSYGLEQIYREYFDTPQMTACCDAHDICYDTCNSDKEKCDFELKRCLFRYCDSFQPTAVAGNKIVSGCRETARLFFAGTSALGCKSYLTAQKNACYCNDKWHNNKYLDSKREL